METDGLWYFLISGQQDAETGLYGNFYTYGKHLGDALNKTIIASKEYDFSNHNLMEASFLDSFEVIEKSEELIEIGEGIFMRQTTYSFPYDDPDKDFIPPIGIVKSVYEGEYEYELIKENFVAYGADENGIYELELVLTKESLINVFLKVIDYLPSTDGFWIHIKNYWNNELTELWVAKYFTDNETIKDFLTNNKKDTLENGYIDIVVHSIQGETNLTLDDHKKIQLHTKDEEVFNNFIGNIIDLGYEQTRDFYNLEFGYHHFHYRLADSLTRTEFKQMLTENKFELMDKWEE
ncbi:MAG: hypothetical protein IPP42_02255 [Saprospiraceae bacterium]|nr:hypothetical protein [Saprospiraceae bacterium]